MTTLTHISSPERKTNLILRYPLASFFVLAIGLTWVFMIADALGSHGIIPFRLPVPLMIVMGYMPTAAALIVAGVTRGREGVRHLLRKLLIARVGVGWYVFAIFAMAAVALSAVLIYNRFGGGPALPIISDQAPPISAPLQFLLTIVPMFIIVGLVNGEELAWRGFALPRLQSRFNALTASLILGVIWALFHLPLFFTQTGSSQSGESFLSFGVATVSLSVLYTWMYNHTRGSVLLAYILHASANTWTVIFPIDRTKDFVGWTLAGLLLLLAVIVVVTNGAANLSRTNARIQE